MSQKIGFIAEQHARDFLQSQGLQWVMSNYRCRLGEIDLIMHDKNTVVFVEVRARVSDAFGGAIGSVTSTKKQKLIKTASLYLLTTRLQEKQPFRFDVLALQGRPPKITWVQNAFGSDF